MPLLSFKENARLSKGAQALLANIPFCLSMCFWLIWEHLKNTFHRVNHQNRSWHQLGEQSNFLPVQEKIKDNAAFKIMSHDQTRFLFISYTGRKSSDFLHAETCNLWFNMYCCIVGTFIQAQLNMILCSRTMCATSSVIRTNDYNDILSKATSCSILAKIQHWSVESHQLNERMGTWEDLLFYCQKQVEDKQNNVINIVRTKLMALFF